MARSCSDPSDCHSRLFHSTLKGESEMRRILCSVLLVVLAVSVQAAPNVSEPSSVQLTVYNSNFALVKDVRSLTLDRGLNSISILDVASSIEPTSILFKSLTAPDSISILEQNYQYDLINPTNILNKSVGQRVSFTTFGLDGKEIVRTGVLLAPPSNGGIVIHADDGGIVLNPTGQVSLLGMPTGLHPKPTLNWLLNSDKAGEQHAEISYIANSMNWSADYVALINRDDTGLDLSGWVSLDNRCGTTFNDAKLTLIAGDVRRIQPKHFPVGRAAVYSELSIDMKNQFEEQSFFEYHMYTMERPTTIANNEIKQLSLLNASGAKAAKELIYDARGSWFRNWWYPGRRDGDPGSGYDTSDYHKVNIIVEFQNSKENRMGMPLPKGKIRVYKLDDTGRQQFIGEDQIDHTPKDEKIRLYIGDAFDVVGDYKRTNYTKVSKSVVEESFEVKIKNHKETPVLVKIVDHVWSDWKVVQKSHDFVKKDASTIEFPVNVDADGEQTITYTIRTSW